MIIDDRYLGDGVYASFDGYHIILALPGQEPTLPVTRILLEPSVFLALIQFNKDLRNAADDEAAIAETESGQT